MGASLLRAFVVIGLVGAAGAIHSQSPTRRLTTVAAVLAFPQYFHLENVVLRGEFVERGARLVLSADDTELHLLNPSLARGGAVEVRGQIIDVGKLQRTDPRLGEYAARFADDEWPAVGTHLALNITAVGEAPLATSATVRSLSLEPWKFDTQTVTVTGNFRGRNLFGELPAAPGRSRYDFVLSAPEGAVWVTNLRPRGRGFDLDVERRTDTNQWLEVTGVVGRHRGMTVIDASSLIAVTAPTLAPEPEPAAPPPAAPPLQVVFSSPTRDETDVSRTAPVRIQFSRGLREPSLADQIRVSYVGEQASPIPFKVVYDAATRAIRLDFPTPLEPYRTVKVELLGAIRAFDNGAFAPWSMTFSLGR